MNTLSKEYVAETKKEIQRLEGQVRSYQSRIETLQDLLQDNAGQETASRVNRKKTTKSTDSETAEVAVVDEAQHENVASA